MEVVLTAINKKFPLLHFFYTSTCYILIFYKSQIEFPRKTAKLSRIFRYFLYWR